MFVWAWGIRMALTFLNGWGKNSKEEYLVSCQHYMKLKVQCPHTGFFLLYAGPPPCPLTDILSMAAFALQRQR